MADIFREIDEELRQERYLKLWKKYGKYAIAAGTVIVLAVAGGIGWKEYRESRFLQDSEAYEAALRLTAEDKRDDAAALFAKLAEDGAGGYAVLSRLNQAALRARGGDAAGAVTLYDAIAADGGVDQPLRDLAALLAAINALELKDADLAAIGARLAPLSGPDNAWRHSAREIQALIAQRQGDIAAARKLYTVLADDPDAPEGVRSRAAEMLALMGGA